MKHLKKFYLFDWDDNVMNMPTPIIYFSKNLDNPIQKLYIPTDVFAETRSKVGNENFDVHVIKVGNRHFAKMKSCEQSFVININDYEIRYENEASFSEFRDGDNNNFLRDLTIAIKELNLGPCWTDFVEAMNDKENAQDTYVITARGHSRKAFFEGLRYIQKIGLIRHILPIENIYCVSNPDELSEEFSGAADNPSEKKKNVIQHIINKAEEKAKKCKHGKKHILGFSDDDKKTFDTLKTFFKDIMNTGDINNVELNLYFTGNKKKERHSI